jgi:hypothetical protein
MHTPQALCQALEPIIGQQPTIMNERKAQVLASKLTVDDEDGWTYRVVPLQHGHAVQVWDDNSSCLGYL